MSDVDPHYRHYLTPDGNTIDAYVNSRGCILITSNAFDNLMRLVGAVPDPGNTVPHG
jgi:hypothetical protein